MNAVFEVGKYYRYGQATLYKVVARTSKTVTVERYNNQGQRIAEATTRKIKTQYGNDEVFSWDGLYYVSSLTLAYDTEKEYEQVRKSESAALEKIKEKMCRDREEALNNFRNKLREWGISFDTFLDIIDYYDDISDFPFIAQEMAKDEEK